MASSSPPKESSRAAACFAEYCAMGPGRSLAKLVEVLRQTHGETSMNLRQVEHYSSDHNWQARVREYDIAQAEAKRHKREEEAERMNDEHALLGRTQAMQAVRRIKDLLDSDRLGSQAAVQLFKYSTDLERVARGEANSVEAQKHSGEIRITIVADDPD